MDRQLLANWAKWLGILASIVMLIGWLVIISLKQSQYGAQMTTDGMWTIGPWIIDTVDIKVILLAIAGILTAFFKNPFLMIIVFLFSFFPAGLYTLGLPGWASIIGMMHILFLFSSLVILSTRYKIVRWNDPRS